MKSNNRTAIAFIIGLLVIIVLSLGPVSCQGEIYEHGKILYKNFCANCHMDDGSGLVGIIPPLAGADFVRDNPGRLPCIIRKGIKGEVLVSGWNYKTGMAGIPQLSEFEITNIINYINTSWGNNYDIIHHEMVREELKACE